MRTRHLTPEQLVLLRKARTRGNRVAKAIDLAKLTRTAVAEEIGFRYTYVTDVAANRWNDIEVQNAHKFADYFGCTIEDLFPSREAVAS